MTHSRVAVLGAGGWGTALAVHLARAGHRVSLWGRDPALMQEIGARRANPTYLPDITLPSHVAPTGSLDTALADAKHIVIAVPSHGLRAVIAGASPHLHAGAVIVSATKGLEIGTLRRMSE